MRGLLRAVAAGARAEAVQILRAPLLAVLAAVQAVTFLLLVSLFGLTGSRAPTALIDEDHSQLSQQLVDSLSHAHNSFSLRFLDRTTADQASRRGELVAVITIPKGFAAQVQKGTTVALPVDVDNVDADLSDDIQRALPSAIAAFGQQHGFDGIRVRPAERDLIDHDTGFIPYLVVSAIALDALVVAGILGAIAVAREFESGTAPLLALSPIHPLAPLAGRLLTIGAVSLAAMGITAIVVMAGYHVIPVHPVEMAAAISTCVVIFGCVGVAIGALIRRTLPVTALVFGIALPLYIDSGSLEPERFDGNTIWAVAHASPVYYAVGVLEDAFHGLKVTPESVGLDLLALVGWALAALFVASRLLRKRVMA